MFNILFNSWEMHCYRIYHFIKCNPLSADNFVKNLSERAMKSNSQSKLKSFTNGINIHTLKGVPDVRSINTITFHVQLFVLSAKQIINTLNVLVNASDYSWIYEATKQTIDKLV